MRLELTYPFEPKSTSMLRPGQFWAVPISNEKFACGRVLQLNAAEIPTKSRMFFGGLHDWLGTALPTSDDIAGAGFVDYGVMHIKAIRTTGGAILGTRSLELDAIQLPLMRSAGGSHGTMILRGSEPLREARRDERDDLPVLGVWGYHFIVKLAEKALGDRIA